TKELEIDRAAGAIDVAVHSAKDVPTEIDPGFLLAGYLPRENVDDLLLANAPLSEGLGSLKTGATVATGSVRRQAQLQHLRPDLTVVDVRGNVPTRMSKLLDPASGFDAMVLARAGLKRLGYSVDSHCQHDDQRLHLAPLAAPDFLPAAGQGAIGLEIRASDDRARSLVEGIEDTPTGQRLKVERAFLALLQAGCHTPVAIHTEVKGPSIRVQARVFAEDDLSRPPLECVCEGPGSDPDALARTIMNDLKA
ncbi:MAG: hydroxymethylbilane synthase, partial [Verrucomicrobiota bacterium]